MTRSIKYIFLFILVISATACLASPEKTTFRSSLVWSPQEGDYYLDNSALPEARIIESSAYATQGVIRSITANWEFEGEVTLEVSANGVDYAAVINGVPLESNFIKGSELKWRAHLAAESRLNRVKIDYSDASGVVTGFGNPALTGLKYRKPLYIKSGAGKNLFNYQVKIELGESARAEDYDVECGNAIENDFTDVRFTCADKVTLLPYYLEGIEGRAPARVATFWIKVPQLPPDALPIYLYYGNPQAEDISSGEDVFDFFDDFAGGDLDSEIWEVRQGGYTVSGSRLKLKNAQVISRDYRIKDGIIEYRAEAGAGDEIRLIARSDKEDLLEGSNQVVYSSGYPGAEHCIAVGDIVKANNPQAIDSGVIYDYRLIMQGTDLTFQRYTEGYGELQSQVDYDDEGGLVSGNIGLKAGSGSTSYFYWVRVRKDYPYIIGVDREASLEVAVETPNLPVFYGTELSQNANLILEDGYQTGNYTSAAIPSPYEVRIFIPGWEVEQGKARLGVSLNGGDDYVFDCVQDKPYYSSRDEFVPGDSLRLKLDLLRKEGLAPELKEVSIDYRPGVITLVYPNGGEFLQAGKSAEIVWSALEYEPTYMMKLEYSPDAGKTYKVITPATENDGTYSWVVPEGVLSNKVLIRISDTEDEAVFDISDNPFTISGKQGAMIPEAEQEEAALLETEESAAEGAPEEGEIDLEKIIEGGRRPGTELYDMVIKLGDNTSLDPEEDAQACYKHGDIVLVRLTGHNWSETEKKSFLIIQVYLTEEEAQQLTQPKKIPTGRLDAFGRPKMKIIKRRANRINLEKLGLSKTDRREGKIKIIRDALRQKTLNAEEIVEEK